LEVARPDAVAWRDSLDIADTPRRLLDGLVTLAITSGFEQFDLRTRTRSWVRSRKRAWRRAGCRSVARSGSRTLRVGQPRRQGANVGTHVDRTVEFPKDDTATIALGNLVQPRIEPESSSSSATQCQLPMIRLRSCRMSNGLRRDSKSCIACFPTVVRACDATAAFGVHGVWSSEHPSRSLARIGQHSQRGSQSLRLRCRETARSSIADQVQTCLATRRSRSRISRESSLINRDNRHCATAK